MKGKVLLVIALLALAGMSACNRTYDPTPEHVDRIFPLEEGRERVYYVVDTIYETSSSALFEERRYFKREYTEGTERDLLGRDVSKLWIYHSTDTLGSPSNPEYAWNYADLWTQYRGEEFSERIEGNTRYLVLRNPAYGGSTWNGNLYNNEGSQIYRYTNIDTTVTVRGITYENCVFVLQQAYYRPVQDSAAAIFITEHAYEIYAPGIGKILRYSNRFEAQSGVVDPESRIYREELVEHNYY